MRAHPLLDRDAGRRPRRPGRRLGLRRLLRRGELPQPPGCWWICEGASRSCRPTARSAGATRVVVPHDRELIDTAPGACGAAAVSVRRAAAAARAPLRRAGRSVLGLSPVYGARLAAGGLSARGRPPSRRIVGWAPPGTHPGMATTTQIRIQATPKPASRKAPAPTASRGRPRRRQPRAPRHRLEPPRSTASKLRAPRSRAARRSPASSAASRSAPKRCP